MGTPEFAAVHLKALLGSPSLCHIESVYTMPDKPRGRSKTPVFCEVKNTAVQNQLYVVQMKNFKSDQDIQKLAGFAPDIIIIVAFGMILPPEVLSIPKYGSINIHASLLPKYRGASPIQHCLMDGETSTGVTSFLLDAGIDTGNLLLQKKIPVQPDDDYSSLSHKLSILGSQCLLETLDKVRDSNFTYRGNPQEKSDTPYAGKITKEMSMLDFSKPASALHNQIRALNDWPVCSIRALVKGVESEIKIYKSKAHENCETCMNKLLGEHTVLGKKTLHIRTSKGCLELLEIQIQGRKRMPVQTFLNGHTIEKIKMTESV